MKRKKDTSNINHTEANSVPQSSAKRAFAETSPVAPAVMRLNVARDGAKKNTQSSSWHALLTQIKLPQVVAALHQVPAPPTSKMALIVVAQLLSWLSEQVPVNSDQKQQAVPPRKINYLLQEMDFQQLLTELEQYQKVIPQGKQVLKVLKSLQHSMAL